MAGQSIFISYRRTDTGGHVRSLYERLRMQFGDDHVFFDRSTIEPGDVFPDRLQQGAKGCAVLLALIGPEWVDVKDERGKRRLDDPNDFVRQEIELALKMGKDIIPVLYEEAPVPRHDELPVPLKVLAKIEMLTLRTRGSMDEYEDQLRKLVERIDLPGTWEQLKDLCKKTTDSSMSDTPRWYKKTLYLERNTVRAHVERFLTPLIRMVLFY